MVILNIEKHNLYNRNKKYLSNLTTNGVRGIYENVLDNPSI